MNHEEHEEHEESLSISLAVLRVLRALRGSFLPLLLLPVFSYAASYESLIRKGVNQLESGDNDKALETFREARKTDPDDPRATYNEGIALYRLGRFEEAASSFGQAAEGSSGRLQHDALYNQGNALYRAKKAGEAVASYRGTLETDVRDPEARHNLQVAIKKKQEQQKQDKKDDKKDQKDKKDEEKDDKQQQQKQQGGVSKEDAKRILESMKEKEKSNFDPDQYNRAGKLAKPENKSPGQSEDW